MRSLSVYGLWVGLGVVGPCFGCSSAPAPSPASCGGSFDALVAMSDYTSSEVGRVSLAGASQSAGGVDLGMDPTLASSAGRFFWIARDLGQIIELDPTCLHAGRTYQTNDPGSGGSSNPYDVAVAPDGSLWIARFDVPTVLVLTPEGRRNKTIDLSSLDPADGNPNMSSIRILDPATGGAGTMATSKAYVALEMLDADLQSTRLAKLARIDLESGKVEDVLTLAGQNPLSLMTQLGNQLYLADAGNWCVMNQCPPGQKSAGVERVDTASFTSHLLVRGDELGGHATELAVTSDCGVVIVAGAYPSTPTSLVRFDPRTGALGTAAQRTVIPTSTTFTLAGLAWVGSDVLLVGDRGVAGGPAGVHVFDAAVNAVNAVTDGCSLRERPKLIPLPMPPVGFAAL